MGSFQTTGLYQNLKKLHTRESLHHPSEGCSQHTISPGAWKGTHRVHQRHFLPVYRCLWREAEINTQQSAGIRCSPQWHSQAAFHGQSWVMQGSTHQDFVTPNLYKAVVPIGSDYSKIFRTKTLKHLIGPQTNFCLTLSCHCFLDYCVRGPCDSASPMAYTLLSLDNVCILVFFFPLHGWKNLERRYHNILISLHERKLYLKFARTLLGSDASITIHH